MKRRFILDSGLNIMASAVPLLILQLIILPELNRRAGGPGDYGVILSAISLLTIPSVFGTSLNNVRLIENARYKERGLEGDFNILLALGSSLASLIALVACMMYYDTSASPLSYLLFLMTGLSLAWREYHLVAFRLTLDYRSIVVNNVLLSVGYLIGFAVAMLADEWRYVYLIAHSASLLHLFVKSSLAREKWRKTEFMGRTGYATVVLLITALLASMTGVADRLLLYPLLGAEAVAIYYVAGVFGKLVSVAVNPVSSVVLSYLSSVKELSTRILARWLAAVLGLAVMGYITGNAACFVLLPMLYPNLAADALAFVPVTTASAMVSAVVVAVKPVVLRFRGVTWQLVIGLVSVIVYFFTAVWAAERYGVMGFAIAVLVSLSVKLGLMLIVYWFAKSSTPDHTEMQEKSSPG